MAAAGPRGVEGEAARGGKRRTLAPEFSGKIVKAFLDSLYAFLDGLVHLASDESPTAEARANVSPAPGTNPLELVDMRNAVRADMVTVGVS